jgi:hypothetical protein
MSDKQIYIAFILDKNEFSTQLLRVAFEYKSIEFWGDPEGQAELKEYFKSNHFSHDEPLTVEPSELFDIMPYVVYIKDPNVNNKEAK